MRVGCRQVGELHARFRSVVLAARHVLARGLDRYIDLLQLDVLGRAQLLELLVLRVGQKIEIVALRVLGVLDEVPGAVEQESKAPRRDVAVSIAEIVEAAPNLEQTSVRLK